MEALLDVIKDYKYKGPNQHKYAGLQHKLIFIVPFEDGRREIWSCQVSPKMRNYVNWVDLIDKFKNNPGHHVEVFDLVPFANKANCFDADHRPTIGDIHRKPGKNKKPSKPNKSSEFNNLFEV